MYRNPSVFFEFQTLVMTSYSRHFSEIVDKLENKKNHAVLLERSFLSSLMTFARIRLSDFQLTILNELSNELIRNSPLLGKIDGFFQIQSKLDTCMKRIEQRGRIGEIAISKDYLKKLESLHNNWKSDNFSPYTPKFVEVITNDDGDLDRAISDVVSVRLSVLRNM